MNKREREYRAIFLAEAQQSYDKISSDVVTLEKDPGNDQLIADIFRLLHNMKANAGAMGLESLADLAHSLENVFSAIRDKEIIFKGKVATVIYQAIDQLGGLITAFENSDQPNFDPSLIASLDSILSEKENEENLSVPITESSGQFTSSAIHLPDTVSISLKKLDDLLNLVGEINTGRDQLLQLGESYGSPQIRSIINNVFRVADRMQENIMSARLVTVSSLFNKFPKIVRDIANSEGKQINLLLKGTDTTIDRNVLSVISDVMIHLVRNAVIHGIESEEERKEVNKPVIGRLEIEAKSEKGLIVIAVNDDGRGIDPQKIRDRAVAKELISEKKANSLNDDESLGLLFIPGFSMASKVTEFAGRGVGLDIVKNVIDSIGGDLKILSDIGQSTTFKMSLPISLSVKTSLLFKVNKANFAVPLLNIYSVLTVTKESIHKVSGELILEHKDERTPLIYLHDFLFSDSYNTNYINLQRESIDIVIVWYNNRKYGLVVDRMYRQQEIMIKPLQKPLDDSELFSGITLLTSGDICYVLDVANIAKNYEQQEKVEQF